MAEEKNLGKCDVVPKRPVTPQAEPGASEPRKEWRCFGCDFVTSDHREAEAHFGDGDEASEFVPVCKWWANSTDDEHKRAYQDLIIELNQARDDCQPAAAPEPPAAVPQAFAGLSDEQFLDEVIHELSVAINPETVATQRKWLRSKLAEVRQRDGEHLLSVIHKANPDDEYETVQEGIEAIVSERNQALKNEAAAEVPVLADSLAATLRRWKRFTSGEDQGYADDTALVEWLDKEIDAALASLSPAPGTEDKAG